MWGARAGVQVSRRELHTHIHLDKVKVEILSCIQKKNLRHVTSIQLLKFEVENGNQFNIKQHLMWQN